ncbi:hypothetical protein FOCG_12555 [Fusarium oxysporum f. sp. radicis-lycopersici 26381]|uniref:Uncharacterized protein n=1 Tax=Fusarium oxysporum Fo47 TaxID=660027 RepID=W9JLV3_FUSOX|nr:hypothetical protein FOZG_14530 [Fusarium oxysporum Fo47]EWZ85569.1 hypothetical protein FOWG_10676 [Fusarium oxysporum f. sp. lycopersici MN25]EXL45144.1 hypothetical protein FOCG_12555 [Fusarium oxysporum f. sp. radicis-lycopersici 26381]
MSDYIDFYCGVSEICSWPSKLHPVVLAIPSLLLKSSMQVAAAIGPPETHKWI